MSPLRKSLISMLLLLALPLVILGPALFGDAVFLPFDPARFPPPRPPSRCSNSPTSTPTPTWT